MSEYADTLILEIGQLVTCASPVAKRGAAMRDVGMIRSGGIAIRGGMIVGVGISADIAARFTAPDIRHAENMTVTPGLIDCHTHAIWGGNRYHEFEQRIGGATYLDILGAGGGILSTMRATRAGLAAGELASVTDERLDLMEQLGTTSVEIKTGYGLSLDSELASLQVLSLLHKHYPDIVPTFLGAHAVPPEFTGDTEGYVRHVIDDMLPAAKAWYDASPFAASGTLFSADVFCERNAFDLDQSQRILRAAKDMGMAVRAHVDEFTDLGGVRMAVELGALSVDHLDVTGADGIAALAASETVGVLMPAVNFNLGSAHYANARAMLEAGAVIALATDLNPGSAPCYSLPMVMAMACRMMKMLPAEAINAVTINAAHALGLAQRIGSLETGKQADLLLCDVSDYRALMYDIGVNHVSAVMKRGVWVK